MGRAKRKHLPQAAASRTDDGEPPLEDSAIEPILHALSEYSDGGGNPSLGFAYAAVAGAALWAIIAVIVVLLL